MTCWCPRQPTLLYTAVLAKINATPQYYRTDPERGWLPDIDHLRSLVTPRTRVLVVIDPNNPTGAVYPSSTRRALDRPGRAAQPDDPRGRGLRGLGVRGDRSALLGALEPDAPIISFSSLSKAYLAPGWRAGWMVVGATPRLDNVLAAATKLADGRLCSAGPMQFAVTAALDRRPVASGCLPARAGRSRQSHHAGAQCDTRHALRAASCGLLRNADGVAPSRTNRRRLRPRPVEGNRDPLRVRIRLRHAGRTGILPHRLSRRPRRTVANRRRYRRFHPGLPRGRLTPCLPALTLLAP